MANQERKNTDNHLPDYIRTIPKYLQQIQHQHPDATTWPRLDCCNSSRSLYCPECARLLVPDLPTDIPDIFQDLPFAIDIVLDEKERKTSATGMHLVALHRAVQEVPADLVRLFYFFREGNSTTIPEYDPETTYVLYPDHDSVPISSVQIQRLVVLDCKWGKRTVTLHPNIRGLTKVHLQHPPPCSYFWRYHFAGKGRVSTIEALYVAICEVASEKRSFLSLLWLFALQRAIVGEKSREEGRLLPFSEEAKERNRLLRTRK